MLVVLILVIWGNYWIGSALAGQPRATRYLGQVGFAVAGMAVMLAAYYAVLRLLPPEK